MIMQRSTVLNKLGLLFILVGLIVSCKQSTTRFESISQGKSGVDFVNKLEPSTDLNIFNYLYFFNGGGVASGDLNGDGLPDLVFTSNQFDNKVYLNKGDFSFEDISDVLKQKDRQNKWTTGVSLVDINVDGLLDIYIGEVGSYEKIEGENKLYVNQGTDEKGIPTFKEQAKKYGLDLVGFSTQAAFFDYDLDGDLDMFQLNHSVHANGTFVKATFREEKHPLAGDKLMRNDGNRFVDVTEESGIYSSALGYGLGLEVTDINQDGFPDLYIGNDFHEDDYLYINNGDGTFTESLGDFIGHTSRFSMGNDIADINNDGLLDIISLDMLPEEYDKLKASAGEDAYDVYQYKLKFGYKYQHARNTLQLNRGNGKFSEIGLMANVFATDWSWSALFSDFDHDGNNDLFVANGIKGRTNDMDYINFASNEDIQMRLEMGLSEDELELSKKMPTVLIPNYAYRNNGDLTFEEVSESWGLNQKTFSNGAIAVDLDLDGDLDIVCNNIDQPASLYRNNTAGNTSSNYINIQFKGTKSNPNGIGAKVSLTKRIDDTPIFREYYGVQGFQSYAMQGVHFGLDSLATVFQLTATWPDGKQQTLTNVGTNQTLILDYADAIDSKGDDLKEVALPPLLQYAEDFEIDYRHRESDFIEFNREGLIPHMISAEGPAFAAGDWNNDGKTDFFFGGSKRNDAYLITRVGNSFQSEIFPEDNIFEDVFALSSDFNSDGKDDLLVLSGGNEWRLGSENLRPRIYLQEDQGLVLAESLLPELSVNASKAVLFDADGDGDEDMFIGARSIPWKYSVAPESYLLIREENGFRVDDTFAVGKGLGLVTGADAKDMDGDGDVDLVVSLEWSSITILFNEDGRFSPQSISEKGLWNTVKVADLNADGRPDIIAGNLGLNSKLKATEKDPLRMYVSDFDQNGSLDHIITLSRDGKEEVFADKMELTKQLLQLKKKYLDFTSFSKASFSELFSEAELSNAETLTITDMESAVFINEEGGFRKRALPIEAQFSPIYAVHVADFDEDGDADILTAGNQHRATIQRGVYDANLGELFLNDGTGDFETATHLSSATLDGDVKGLYPVKVDGKEYLIVTRNNQKPLIIN